MAIVSRPGHPFKMNHSERDLTAQSFERFLARLDANRERAGEAYEELRLMLVKFFEWRHALFPDELADETINRVIRKLEAEAGAEDNRIQNLTSYSFGVARLVFFESLKSPAHKHTELTDLPSLIAPPRRSRRKRRRRRTPGDCNVSAIVCALCRVTRGHCWNNIIVRKSAPALTIAKN